MLVVHLRPTPPRGAGEGTHGADRGRGLVLRRAASSPGTGDMLGVSDRYTLIACSALIMAGLSCLNSSALYDAQ